MSKEERATRTKMISLGLGIGLLIVGLKGCGVL